MKRRVGILIGGRGSNMLALAGAARAPGYPAEVALVVSHGAEAHGLAAARTLGLETVTLEAGTFAGNRRAHEAAVAEALDAAGVEVVCLAGWMRLLTPFLVARYAGRMLNVHPSLLPAFPGLHTHRRALAAGVALHGCTVHLVTEAMDEGPVLAQAAVPVRPGDTEATLADRVLRQEHVLYPATLARFVSGRAGVAAAEDAALCNPLPLAAPLA